MLTRHVCNSAVQAACFATTITLLTASPAYAAQGRTLVRASSEHSAPYLPEFAVDGDVQTRWASHRFSGKPEWLEIDLGKTLPVNNLVIHWEHAYAARYQIQLSVDGRDWKTVHEQPTGKGGKEVIAGLSGKGRYLRVTCLQPSEFGLFSIWEVEFPDEPVAQAVAEVSRQQEANRRRAADEARVRTSKALSEQGVSEIVFAMRQPGKDGHWYANFSYYCDDEDRVTYGNGGKLCRLNLATGEVTTILQDTEGGIRDPVVHYDGRKILFSYREGGNCQYHLYEIDLDGGNLRQLTDGPYDDIEPCYLPDGKIVFVSSRCNRWVQCWLTKVAVLHRCDADGSNIRAISANLEHDNTPWPMPDGRVLYQRWEYVDRSQVDYHHLWTTNPDGTRQMVFYGNMHPGTLMIDAKPIPDSRKVVAIFSPGHGRREHEGIVTVVDPQNGPDDRSSARSITRGANYRDPWALSEETFIAAQGQRIVLLDAAGVSQELFHVSSAEAAAGLECHEPRPVIRRLREPVISDRTNAERTTGEVVLVDVYKGRNMEGVKRGEIKKLLVIESLPKPINFTGGMDPLTYGGSFTLERVLGTVPVEPDGSAYVELPALRAVFFVALDENDLAVKRMQSFLSVQPGEVTSCVGCHEKRSETFLPSADLLAIARPASRIEPIDNCPDVFDFPRDIQPILDTLCLDCHGYQKTQRGGPYAGKVLLAGDRGPMFSHAYFTMTVRRLFTDNRNQAKSNYSPRSLGSSASRILKMLDGSHYGVQATSRQEQMLRLWIEVGAPYPGTYAALGCGSVGGYIQNAQINTDLDWPTTKAGADVIQRRCASCHQGSDLLPQSLSDERGVSFWRFSLDDPRLKMSRHIVFNLTRPQNSLLLLAPLAERAGGFGSCRDKQGNAVTVFSDTANADYQTLLKFVAAGKTNLETIKRFDMPGFRPRPQYLREMKRYGILPASHADDAQVDVYDLDRRYWRSLWYTPETGPASNSAR
ncbi:MAG TPA: discoidin domain-containing protein [Pirellulaceae bacterium]|nr:discoidin domain-containing protein [Pirellulaceae bacterium]